MATTKVLIISNAFVLLGKQPIQSIDTGNPVQSAASTIYDLIKKSTLSERPWRFALKQFNINKLIDVPIINEEWNYIYQLPADCLTPYRTYPNDLYALYEDKLYSNQSGPLKLEYVYDASETEFSSNFTLLMTYKIASNIAMTVTQQASLAKMWEEKTIEQSSIAAAVDALAMPNTFIQNDSLYSAHVGY